MKIILNVSAVKRLMAENRMTVRQIAKLCGTAPQNLSAILKRGSCSAKTGGMLADALGVSVEEIWKEE